MKKNISIIIIILAVVIGGFFYNNKLGSRSSVNYNFNSDWQNSNFLTTSNPTKVATSTVSSLGNANYILSGAASSTKIVDISSSDNLFMNVYAFASSTATTFQYNLAYTYDDIASTTGWYYETSGVVSSGVETLTPKVLHKLLSASSSPYHHIILPDNKAKKIKVEYTVYGTSADVYMDIHHK